MFLFTVVCVFAIAVFLAVCMSEWARVSTMRASTRRSGSIFDVAQFFVINLVIIFIYMCCFPTADARKSMPPLIDDDQHVRMNKPGEFSSVFFFWFFLALLLGGC